MDPDLRKIRRDLMRTVVCGMYPAVETVRSEIYKFVMKVFDVQGVTDRITVVYNYTKSCHEHISKDDYLVIIGYSSFRRTHEVVMEEVKSLADIVTKPPIYIASFNDMAFVENNSLDSAMWNTVSWFQSQYISASFQLANFNKYVVTSGGFQSNWHSWDRARSNMLQATVGFFRGNNWHTTYDGRFGYVISGSYGGGYFQNSLSMYEIGSPTTLCHVGSRGVDYKKLG